MSSAGNADGWGGLGRASCLAVLVVTPGSSCFSLVLVLSPPTRSISSLPSPFHACPVHSAITCLVWAGFIFIRQTLQQMRDRFRSCFSRVSFGHGPSSITRVIITKQVYSLAAQMFILCLLHAGHRTNTVVESPLNPQVYLIICSCNPRVLKP